MPNFERVRSNAIELLERRQLYSMPTLSTHNISVTEGTDDVAQISVFLSDPTSRTVKVTYTTKSATAMSAVDFVAHRGTLVISPGMDSASIDIPLLDNAGLQSAAKFYVDFKVAVHATLPAGLFSRVVVQPDPTVDDTPYDLSDNLSFTSYGSLQAIGGNELAAGFDTIPARTLLSVTLLLDQAVGGDATVSIYTDTGPSRTIFGSPGTLVGTLNSPSTFSTSLAPTTFTTSGISLLANKTYWIVLNPNGGTYSWGRDEDNGGDGVGFTGESETLGNEGIWQTNDLAHDLQFSVSTVD